MNENTTADTSVNATAIDDETCHARCSPIVWTAPMR